MKITEEAAKKILVDIILRDIKKMDEESKSRIVRRLPKVFSEVYVESRITKLEKLVAGMVKNECESEGVDKESACSKILSVIENMNPNDLLEETKPKSEGEMERIRKIIRTFLEKIGIKDENLVNEIAEESSKEIINAIIKKMSEKIRRLRYD
jgi:hypothetical protein